MAINIYKHMMFEWQWKIFR